MSEYNLADHFQIRLDESTGLKGLFEKVFFDVEFPAGVVEALKRTEFQAGATAAGADDGAAESGEEPSAPVRAPDSGNFGDLPRTVLLYRGGSGVGKTRIFRQFRVYAEERRIPVYEIHCYDVEGIPFKPFLRVIREILRDFEFGEVLREKYRPGLERLLPEVFQEDLREDTGAHPLEWEKSASWEEDKLRIFDGITQLLFEITSVHPVVILIHDLSWGDQGTIELLRYIGRNVQLRNFRVPSWAGRDGKPYTEHERLPDDSGLDDPERVDFNSGGSQDPPRPFLDAQPREGKVVRRPAAARRGGDKLLEDAEQRPVRLMVVSNYEGLAQGGDGEYLERSLCSLGKEPFAYHGEIRTLNLEETRRFVDRALGTANPADGETDEASGVDFDDDAVARIHELSQGFPGYICEMIRVVLEHAAGEGRPLRVSAEVVDRSMPLSTEGAQLETAPPAGPAQDTRVEGPESEDTGESEAADASGGGTGAPPSSRRIRYRIIERRLGYVNDEELAILRALALARKPLTTDFLAKVTGQSVDRLSILLSGLESRAYLEKVGQLFPHGGKEDGHYFRIWDYSEVIGRSFDDPRARAELHRKIGAELRERLGTAGEEKAYEVFYHLLRGPEPRACLPYGLVAARRLARSFSIEKALLVLDDLLGLLDPGEDARVRLEILEMKSAYFLALGDFGAAETAIGELLEAGEDENDDERRAELLIRQSEVCRLSGDTNKALKILSKAIKHIRDPNSLLAARWHLASGRSREDRGDVKRAVNLGLKGMKICRKCLDAGQGDGVALDGAARPGHRDLALLHGLLARAYWRRGDDSHAVDNFQRSLETFQTLGDEAAAARVLDDLGNVYLDRGNYFRAARYFYKALEIKRRIQDIAGLCKSYDELGMVYLRTGDEIKTIGLLNHSIHLKEKIGDLEKLNPTLGILGELYFRLGRYTKAIAYFQREIHNSQALSNTSGLVDAFCHLGWVYHEIGDRRQVENLTRQIGILASEFKLREQEAAGARLRGNHEALHRNWDAAEAQLRLAIETYSKLGNRRKETESLLDQAELRYAREAYNDALKIVSKALLAADQLKAVDLQVRAHIVKGNLSRFLKGGSLEKAKEQLRQGLELGRAVNDSHLLFSIYYSLAKVYHYDHEFVEAGTFYGKAEAILRRIADDLPDDLAVRYFEHPSRQVFLEDANRYRKEVKGRSATETVGDPRERLGAFSRMGLEERPIDLDSYKSLNTRVLRLHAAQHADDFFAVLLREAVDLVQSERAFILRVQNRQYFLAAHTGFGAGPGDDPDFPSAQAMAEETVRKGKPILISGGDGMERDAKYPELGSLVQRTLLIIPLATPDRIFGALYVDRPLSLGKWTSRDQVLLESMAGHAGCALENRRHYETAILEPLTGLHTTSYFLECLKDTFRFNNLHGKPFFLVGFYMPTLESSMKDGSRLLGERLVLELQEELPPSAVACWGSPILSILVSELDFGSVDRLAQRVQGRLIALVNCRVPFSVLAPEARFSSGLALYFELRRNLLPEEGDQHTLMEIRQLLARDITLKDAKRILERHIIENTLKKTGGNITHAAKELGIHRPQLSNLLKKHELKRERFEHSLRLDHGAN